MTLVIDASAAAEIALNKEDAGFFQEQIDLADVVLAPDIFPSEITNIFWKYSNYSDLSVEKCQSGIECCIDLIDDYINTHYLCREVFSASVNSKHSAYDIFYIIVARRNNASIITKDKKMKLIAKELGVTIIENLA